MSDSYINFSRTTVGKKLCSILGMPVPQMLKRADDAPDSLVSKILLGGLNEVTISSTIKDTLTNEKTSFTASDSDRFDGFVFDATAITCSDELSSLYHFFNQHVKKLNASGKVVVVGIDPKKCITSLQATAQRGLVGFVKALAKEVGRKGATVNLIFKDDKVDNNLAGSLRYFLSYRSAYVNGQVVTLNNFFLNTDSPRWDKPLLGKIALVTGASRGIGASISQVLARDGAKVIGLDIPQMQSELQACMRAIGGEAIVANITDEDAPKIIESEIAKSVGAIDIIVHNAGITRDKMLVTMAKSQWDQVIDVNLSSIERINAYLLNKNSINAGGRILCVSSISGIAGNLGQTNYATSKASIIGLIESMSDELLEKNITINAVAPGFIETSMTASIPATTRFIGRRMCALSQGGLPVDVAETISFLAAPQSQAISANLIRVCGLNIMGA